LVVVFDAFEVEKQYEDGRSDRESAEAKIRKADVEGKNSGTALKLDKGVAEEELRRAEDVAPTDAQIFSRNEILESQSDRNLLQKRVTTTEQKRDPTERLAAADVALADIEKRKAELRLRQAQDSLNSLRVVAPHDGILVFPMSWRGDAVAVGDTVWPSQPLAELPDLQSLEAHVFVLEGDGGGLAAGQKATVEIEGQPGLVFDAKIARVDAVAKTRDRNSPVKYFETTLSFDAVAVAKAGLKPGQKVRASVLIDDLQDVLAIPRGGLFEKDGRRMAYRLERGRFVPVDIKVGRRSVGKVVVEQGLSPGDRIALYDPERRANSPAQPQAGPALGPSGR
jgi:RND family efflux transporter MFP subunit